MRKLVPILGLMLLVSLAASPAARAQDSSPLIRVGLWSGQANIVLSAGTDFSLADAASQETLGKYKAGEKVAVSVAASGLTVNGREVAAREITVALPDNAPAGIEVNRRTYRGAVTVRRTVGKAGLTGVNTLPLEEYITGVVAREIPPAWPPEAVKAQAVAARTLALYSLGKHAADGYDVCATVDCQIYGGKTNEDARASKAVSDTRGLVATYEGKPIPAYFHDSGGGYTDDSEAVLGGYFPFLRGVAVFDEGAAHYKWEKQLTPKEVEEALAGAGIQIGALQAIELSRLGKQPVAAPDRGVSGRVTELRLIGSTDSARISGARFSAILGLGSTLFDIDVTIPAEKMVEFEITDSYGDHDTKTVPIKVKPLPETGFAVDKDNIRRVSGRANETLVFTGFGQGNGLGLSQWGAKAMAEKAPPGDTEYFREILKHYYTGIEIQKLY